LVGFTQIAVISAVCGGSPFHLQSFLNQIIKVSTKPSLKLKFQCPWSLCEIPTILVRIIYLKNARMSLQKILQGVGTAACYAKRG